MAAVNLVPPAVLEGETLGLVKEVTHSFSCVCRDSEEAEAVQSRVWELVGQATLHCKLRWPGSEATLIFIFIPAGFLSCSKE